MCTCVLRVQALWSPRHDPSVGREFQDAGIWAGSCGRLVLFSGPWSPGPVCIKLLWDLLKDQNLVCVGGEGLTVILAYGSSHDGDPQKLLLARVFPGARADPPWLPHVVWGLGTWWPCGGCRG